MTLHAWKDILRRARDAPARTDREQRRCHELTNQTLTIPADSADEPLGVVRGVGWYYPSDDELESIVLGEHGPHIYSFSAQIAQQLPRVTKLLRERPNTRRAHIRLADETAYEYEQEHVPCLLTAHFHRDEHLHITVHARSIDLLLGLPANLFQTKVLLEHVADELNTEPGTVTLFINNAHVFDDYSEELERVLGK